MIFGQLPPFSCDGLCKPKQVWSTEFLIHMRGEKEDQKSDLRVGPSKCEKLVVETYFWSFFKSVFFSNRFCDKPL